jgi:hypothetical protein
LAAAVAVVVTTNAWKMQLQLIVVIACCLTWKIVSLPVSLDYKCVFVDFLTLLLIVFPTVFLLKITSASYAIEKRGVAGKTHFDGYSTVMRKA